MTRAVVFPPWTNVTLSGPTIEPKSDADPLISPAFADLTGLPPLLIQVGSHEVLPHAFQGQAGSLDEADAALDRASRFLSERLVREPLAVR